MKKTVSTSGASLRLRHLHLGFEVADGPQPADDEAGADPASGLDGEAVEGDDLDARGVRPQGGIDRFPEAGHALLRRPKGRLLGIHEEGDHDTLEDVRSSPHDVEVAVRHRVEGARIEGGRHGLASVT
jgi:hypothetical protein